MILQQKRERIRNFRKTVWEYQETFVTPEGDLTEFVNIVVQAIGIAPSLELTVDQYIFEPRHLKRLLEEHKLPPEYSRGWSISVNGAKPAALLLEAAFRDSLDFIVRTSPSRFAIFADHDGYCTFLAHTKGNLNHVIQPMFERGMRRANHFTRKLGGS